MKYIYYILTTILILLAACEKVIDPNLKDVEPLLVIEGEITDKAGPHTVKISKTSNFTEASQFLGVENATVIISDNTGIIDTLTMQSPGIYNTSKIIGTPGNTYHLTVITKEETYTAQSTMPLAVKIDTLFFLSESYNTRSVELLMAFYTDPIEIDNYYRFKVFENGEAKSGISISNDYFYNGILTQNTLTAYPPDKEIPDSIEVHLMSIDKNTYDYFSSLILTIRGNTASPANPQSQISGGCLGYFSAHTLDIQKIIQNK